MERFIKILNWCKEHPFPNNGVNEINNIYKKAFEMGIGFPVSRDEIACCYKILGYNVEKIFSTRYVDGYYWQISTK